MGIFFIKAMPRKKLRATLEVLKNCIITAKSSLKIHYHSKKMYLFGELNYLQNSH